MRYFVFDVSSHNDLVSALNNSNQFLLLVQMIDKEQLKRWAVTLEQELENYRSHPDDIADICECQLLIESIQRAKAQTIEVPTNLKCLSYYLFETRIRNYKSLTRALNGFSSLLDGCPLSPGNESRVQ